MIDELINDYCILADDGAVIFASYDHVLEFVDKIRADERKRKTLAELLDSTPVDAVNMSEERVHKTDNQIMFKRLESYEFAINEYEQALKAAFPQGATGDAFYHWNDARKHGGRPYLSYERKESPEMDEDMREMQQEIDSLLKANMELQADAEAWRNFKAKTLLVRVKK